MDIIKVLVYISYLAIYMYSCIFQYETIGIKSQTSQMPQNQKQEVLFASLEFVCIEVKGLSQQFFSHVEME